MVKKATPVPNPVKKALFLPPWYAAATDLSNLSLKTDSRDMERIALMFDTAY